MPDVLDQDEVNALLEAVEEGKIEVASPSEDVRSPEEVYLYDFKRPERVSKEQMRSLETLHEIFARNFSATLTGRLRTICEVKLVSVEQLTYSEFILSLPNPSCFNLIQAQGLEGDLVLELNPSIVFPIIDKLLGGPKDTVQIPQRALTLTEWQVISPLIRRGLKHLSEIWARIQEIEFSIKQQETNPQLMQIVAPNEPAVLICFELTMGESSGLINLCIPYMVLDPIVGQLTTQAWFAYSHATRNEKSKDHLFRNLAKAHLDTVCYLARTKMKMNRFLELRVGDVIEFPGRARGEILLCVERNPKFWGNPGIFRSHKALKVTRIADKKDEQ